MNSEFHLENQSTPGERLLEVDRLFVSYGAIQALRDVSMHVATGEIVTVLGANGAGKSTLLAAITGLAPVASGSIRLAGTELVGRSTEAVVGRGVALSMEGRRIFSRLTVEENLRLGAGPRGQREYERRRAGVADLFPVLDRKANDFAGLLSGGEQQQLAIARALMSSPRLLLLDEPSLGLAPLIVTAVFYLVEELRRRGLTIVLVEQNATRALQIADRAYVLRAGSVELEGDTHELRSGTAVQDAYLGAGATV